ncbi:MAG: hypothetical protein QOG71_3782 [Pyrinomonadaceae bacterium]|nr:hypothetical protein [Pyrinomonadaceae bacterium]
MRSNVPVRAIRQSESARPSPRRVRALLSLALLLGAGVAGARQQQSQQPAQQSSPEARAKASLPADLSKLDTRALIREVAESERAMQTRRLEYTWTARVTERETGKRGEIKKETLKVYEVYPVRGEFVRKLLSENGVPVSPQEAEKQFKKAVENLERAAREEEKRGASGATPPPPRATTDATGIPTFGFSNGFKFRDGLSTGEFSFAPWRILRAGEFFATRRESLGGREVIVMDFRPRADFVPVNDLQKPYGKLGGRVWIDVGDRTLARLEAWPLAPDARGAPQAALPARPNEPSIIYEETRLPDGMWLESLVQINTNANKAVFNGVEVNTTKAASDFKRFEANAGDAKVEQQKEQ